MATYTPFAAGYFLGNVETFTTTASADVEANTLVTAGCLKGMTRQQAKSGETVVAFLSGKLSHYHIELATTASETVSQGTEIYLNSDGKATSTDSGNTRIGCLYQEIAVGETFADVLIFPPGPNVRNGMTETQVNALIDAKLAEHAALATGSTEGTVHPGA